MSLQATVEALPAKISEAVKSIFASNKAELDTLSAQATQAQADLVTARASIATLTQERDLARAATDSVKAELAAATTKAAAVEAEAPAKIAAAASAKAAEINAGLGMPPVPIKTEAAPGTEKPLLQQHAEIKDPKARAEFWAKHRKEIVGE